MKHSFIHSFIQELRRRQAQPYDCKPPPSRSARHSFVRLHAHDTSPAPTRQLSELIRRHSLIHALQRRLTLLQAPRTLAPHSATASLTLVGGIALSFRGFLTRPPTPRERHADGARSRGGLEACLADTIYGLSFKSSFIPFESRVSERGNGCFELLSLA